MTQELRFDPGSQEFLPLERGQTYTILIQRIFHLSLQVFRDEERPLADTALECRGADKTVRGRTDAEGRVHIANVPVGEYALHLPERPHISPTWVAAAREADRYIPVLIPELERADEELDEPFDPPESGA